MESIQQLPPKVRCQSCGRPVGAGFFGTNSDGGDSREYCQYCWQGGVFTNPDLTMEAMIAQSIEHMMDEQQYSEERASEVAHTIIPTLKRWHEII